MAESSENRLCLQMIDRLVPRTSCRARRHDRLPTNLRPGTERAWAWARGDVRPAYRHVARDRPYAEPSHKPGGAVRKVGGKVKPPATRSDQPVPDGGTVLDLTSYVPALLTFVSNKLTRSGSA